mmetsp:Transcript_53214/g.123890  ORF Transcript_53214/g.123890 Transcript_53214/m.123890 type:complete len:216 (+) Transcript_53214:718-1365(+)
MHQIINAEWLHSPLASMRVVVRIRDEAHLAEDGVRLSVPTLLDPENIGAHYDEAIDLVKSTNGLVENHKLGPHLVQTNGVQAGSADVHLRGLVEDVVASVILEHGIAEMALDHERAHVLVDLHGNFAVRFCFGLLVSRILGPVQQRARMAFFHRVTLRHFRQMKRPVHWPLVHSPAHGVLKSPTHGFVPREGWRHWPTKGTRLIHVDVLALGAWV